MRKHLSFLLLIQLLGAQSIYGLQVTEWIKLSPIGGGFSVMMPGKAEEEVKSEPDFTLHLFTLTTEKAIYLAGYGDYAPSVHLNAAGELSANRDNFLKSVSARLIESKDIKIAGRAGLEFTGKNDSALFKSRIYLFGNRVHQVAVAVFQGKDDTANVEKFFASFSFTKP